MGILEWYLAIGLVFGILFFVAMSTEGFAEFSKQHTGEEWQMGKKISVTLQWVFLWPLNLVLMVMK